MAAQNYPAEVIEAIKDSVDCNLYFFGNKVELSTMFLVLCGAIALLAGTYILMNALRKRA